MSNRDTDCVATVDLRVMVSYPKGGYSVDLVQQAFREALARKVAGFKAVEGHCALRGVESFIEDDAVNLPGGGVAILKWQSFDPNALELVP